GDDAGLAQHLQMMADGGLGKVERGGQVADAYLAALVGTDQRQQPQPDRVTECLEHLRQSCRRGIADRLTHQRYRALRGIGRWSGYPGELQCAPAWLYRHSPILTAIHSG